MLAQPIVEIRRANQRDAAAIELLIRESFREHEPAYTPEAFDLATPREHEIENRIKEWTVWVAVRANVIVGTISAYSEGSGMHIRTMAVHRACEGRELENCCSGALKILPPRMVTKV
jgi:N-acetylglutamate synthase-like GNAT family acetyltransferase